MARKPRRTRLDCSFNWVTKRVRGHHIVPPVTTQPVDDYCGAHAAVEAFESRARLLNAKINQPFPTLSILHLIDQLRDALAAATTSAAKQRVRDEETPFKLLRDKGVVSKQDYDAAPAGEGFARNVQGLQHYRITGYRVCNIKANKLQHRHPGNVEPVKYTLNEITDNGPVYGWFVLDAASFSAARHGIYRAPPAAHKSNTHAVLLYGFGARGRTTSAMCYQNNWGRQYHVNGRGLIEMNSIVAVIIPNVQRNW